MRNTLVLCLFFAACGSTDEKPRIGETRATDVPATAFVLRLENVSGASTVRNSEGDEHVPLSPGVYAVFTGDNPLFLAGGAATPGIERIAEDGAEAQAARELAAHRRVVESGRFEVPAGGDARGALAPGEAYEIRFRAGPGERLTFATMFGISNDLFYGPAAISLFDGAGRPVTGDVTAAVALWDAGTERNEEPGTGPNQPENSPADTGPAEGGVVKDIRAVRDGYAYPAVSEVIRATLRLGTAP